MLAQVVLGSLMHVWDCLSDFYVIFLWSTAGRTSLVHTGIVFCVLTPLLTC
jgi:hypothetical protein